MIFATVVIAVAVVGAAPWIRGGFSAAAEPSWLENKVARRLRNFSIPHSARVQTNPWKPKAENLQPAQEIFLARCAVCHGYDGSGATQVGRGLSHWGRNGMLSIGNGVLILWRRERIGGRPCYPPDNMLRPTGPTCDGCHSVGYDITTEIG